MLGCTGEKTVHTSTQYLEVDAIDLPVLVLQLGAHINRHVAQITNHRVHLAHIILHLHLAIVVRDAPNVTTRHTSVVHHHTLRLIIDDLSIVVALPRAFIFLKR